MKLIKLLLIALTFNVCVNAQPKADDVLHKLQQKFNSINDLSADFKQFATAGSNQGALTGKYFFKKKDQFRIELKTLTIASDGKVNWNYNIKTKKYIVNNAEPNDPSNLSLNRFVYDYPAKCKVTVAGTESLGGSECVIVELVPNKGNLNFKKAKLWKDNSDLIKRISFEDQSGTTMTVDLSNIKINQKLPDSKFILSPPEGSKVIDLR